MRKFLTLFAALVLVATAVAPAAEARDRHGGYYDGRYDHHRRYRDRDDHGDAVAAGVIGLVLGLAVGSMASQSNEPRGCYDNYRRCDAPPPPPPRYYNQGYDDGYLEGGYDPRYDDRYGDRADGYYDDDRGCTRTERQWDRYANRYVMVDVPC